MKRCASCSKDLPDAALHCVFCGAKQPQQPAPMGLAKTAFGYSPNEAGGVQSPAAYAQTLATPGAAMQPGYPQQPQAPYPQPGYPQPQAPYPQPGYPQPQAQHPQPGYPQPGYPQPGYPQPGYPQPGYPPTAPAMAPTMMVAPPQAQPMPPQRSGPSQPPPRSGPSQPPPLGMAGMGIHAQNQITPQPLPASPSPFPPTAASRAGRPIEPWRDSLRVVLFVWGVVTLVAFVLPVATHPSLVFGWDAILHGDTKTKLATMLVPGLGALALVFGALPMPVVARGLLAALLGLAGMAQPFIHHGMPPWQELAQGLGLVVLVTGLLVRNEYCDSIAPRLLVTLGAVFAIVPFVLPDHGQIPLVNEFKGVLSASGSDKVADLLPLALIVIIVISLLAWMPGPATAGGKVFAWLVIVWSTLILTIVPVLLSGHVGDALSGSPRIALAWAPPAAFLAFAGYGLATVFGKQLE